MDISPVLILQNKNFDNYGSISDYSGLTYKNALNAPNEISFTTYKYKNGKKIPLWDKIVDLKILYIPEFEERYEIKVSDSIDGTTTKSVTGTSLGEAETSQVLLRDIEINTDIDFENDLYDENFPTIFYRDWDNQEYIDSFNEIWDKNKGNKDTDKYSVYNKDGSINIEETIALRKDILKHSSLLHRLMEKAPHYTIEHVDKTLKNLDWIRSFSISNQNLYSELTGEISEEFGVLFKFNSIDRTISVYDMYNTCDKCGKRGDFDTVCPECGSTKFHGQYGKDTTILVSAENLASELTKTGDPDSIKTYYKIEGGDDLMTAAVASVNPSGSSYIISIPDYMLEEMPQEMQSRITSYNDEVIEYTNTYIFELTQKYVDDYNEIVEWLMNYYDKATYPTITSSLIGYPSTTELYFNLIDIESVLKDSLLPTIKTINPTIEESMGLIDELNESVIAVKNPSTCVPSSADNAVLGMIKATINTALYKPEIIDSSYDNSSFEWIGTIRLTCKEVEDGEKAETLDRTYTFNISDDLETYLKQQIQKNMARSDVYQILDLTSLDENTRTDEWLDDFKDALHFYSSTSLSQLQTEFLTAQSVIIELRDSLDNNNELKTLYGEPSQYFYDILTKRISLVSDELDFRNDQLEKLYNLYYRNSSTGEQSGELYDIRKEVNYHLNFQKWMETEPNYWKTFCSYLREDTYSNDNYISDGLSNQELIKYATELYNKAKEEIEKSSYNQYTIDSTMNNLLMIPEFKPLINNFKIGNWIKVAFEDEIHKLRLLSYQINFESLENLDVEFSTVIHSPTGSSDLKSIINSAANIASTYNADMKQMQKTSNDVKSLNDALENSIDSTKIKIVNDELVEDVVIDKNGILGRAYDDIDGKYDDCQYKFIRNGLYMTNDNWKSIYNAIGKFQYDTGQTIIDDDGIEKSVYATAYGVKADTIVGNLIFGRELKITNKNNTLSFDIDGLLVDNGVSTIQINPNDLNGILFRISTGYDDDRTNVMFVDNKGNGHFEGIIDAKAGGSIGGWLINADSISKSFDYSIEKRNSVYDKSSGKTLSWTEYKDGTSSFTLSSSDSVDYALKLQYDYNEWTDTNSEKTKKYDEISLLNDATMKFHTEARSDEGSSSYENTMVSPSGIIVESKYGSTSSSKVSISAGLGFEVYDSNENLISYVDNYGGAKFSTLSVTSGIIETVTYSITTDQYGQASFGDASLANQYISVISNDYRYGVFWIYPNNVRVFDIYSSGSTITTAKNVTINIICKYIKV